MKSAHSPVSLVEAVRKDIASMRTRGAGEIGKQAVRALAEAAQRFSGQDAKAFAGEVLAAARALAAARPTAVTLRNGLNAVVVAAHASKDIVAAKAAVAEASAAYSRRVDSAKARIAEAGAKLVRDGATILTHCHSTAVVGVFQAARGQGKSFRVIATETRPFGQGLITAPALREAGVDVSLIVDSAALHVMEQEKVAHVFVGADAVGADGSLYNKIGTRQVTLAAKSLGIPVSVFAEVSKFSPYTMEGEAVVIEERPAEEVVDPAKVRGVRVLNPVFDRTPPEQVTRYVTDEGVLAPKEVRPLMERLYGKVTRWI